jgi:hypothetical protein
MSYPGPGRASIAFDTGGVLSDLTAGTPLFPRAERQGGGASGGENWSGGRGTAAAAGTATPKLELPSYWSK